MGQTNSSPYSISPSIQKTLVAGTWQSALLTQGQLVYMNAVSENPFQHKYIVKLNSTVPRDCNMAILFPNHPVEKRRILWTAQYSSSKHLSLEINKRIQESSRESLMIAIASGENYYCFQGFVGNLYLIWAERVSLQTINHQENDIGENIPILIETNGQMRYRSVFIMDEDCANMKVTPIKDISWFDPFHDEIFCCETDIRKEVTSIVPTVSNSYADQVTRDPVVRSIVSLDEDPVPFSDGGEDIHMEIDSARQLNYEIHGNPLNADEERIN